MPEDLTIRKTAAYSFKGYFTPRELFDFFNQCVEDLGYEVMEKEFKESTDKGKEIAARFEAEKPLNDYYLSKLKYMLKVTGQPITIESDGKTIDTYDGSAELLIRGILVQDFLNKREDTPLGKFLSQLYSKYLSKDEVKDAEGVIIGDYKEVINRLKQYVNSEG